MQEDKQIIVYRRGKIILGKAIALAFVVIAICTVGFEISQVKRKLEEQDNEIKLTLRDFSMKQEFKKMTNQYKDFRVEVEKKIAEAETSRKVIVPSAVTYVEEKKSNETPQVQPAVNPISYNKDVPTEYSSVHEMKATAYCLCKKCCGKSPSDPHYGETSSGLKIIPGTGMKVIAVDPKVIPLGSKVYVEGLNGAGDYGYAIAADRGSAIKNNKIDLYMDTHELALKWGRKSVRVYVVE